MLGSHARVLRRAPEGRVAVDGEGVWKFLDQLRSWQLLALTVALFLADLLVPDPLPFLDEILLGVLTVFLAKWKKDGRQ